jgi:hypothetical protein
MPDHVFLLVVECFREEVVFWVGIRAKKENRKLPPKLSLAHFSPFGSPPGAPAPPPIPVQPRGGPVVTSLSSPPPFPFLHRFFLRRPTEFPPPRGPAGLLPPPRFPLLGLSPATHSTCALFCFGAAQLLLSQRAGARCAGPFSARSVQQPDAA